MSPYGEGQDGVGRTGRGNTNAGQVRLLTVVRTWAAPSSVAMVAANSVAREEYARW